MHHQLDFFRPVDEMAMLREEVAALREEVATLRKSQFARLSQMGKLFLDEQSQKEMMKRKKKDEPS